MDGSFIKSNKEIKNKSLNLLEIELLSKAKNILIFHGLKYKKYAKTSIFDDSQLKFQPKKEIMQSYINFF